MWAYSKQNSTMNAIRKGDKMKHWIEYREADVDEKASNMWGFSTTDQYDLMEDACFYSVSYRMQQKKDRLLWEDAGYGVLKTRTETWRS
jgi:hypothetical protein